MVRATSIWADFLVLKIWEQHQNFRNILSIPRILRYCKVKNFLHLSILENPDTHSDPNIIGIVKDKIKLSSSSLQLLDALTLSIREFSIPPKWQDLPFIFRQNETLETLDARQTITSHASSNQFWCKYSVLWLFYCL